MEARAVSRYIRISPRKARLVADLVRGKSVAQALGILALTPKKASPILRKAILSAAANVRQQSEGGEDLGDARLWISELRVDPGPTMKRIRPRAQGRAYRILKRMSHIQVTVTSDE
jgi:large subunit ribosomal protein L22